MASFSVVAGAEPEADPNKAAIDWKKATYHRLSGNLARPLDQRVIEMSDDMLRDLIDDDRSIGITGTGKYSTRPAASAELELMQRYLALLPVAYREAFREKLLAIFLVDDFAGAGMTSWVLDEAGEIYYYMILNTALLERSLDE